VQDMERVLCECGSLISTRSRYCGFCGNRMEVVSLSYVYPGTYQVATIPKSKVEYREEVDYDMISPSWVKPDKMRKSTIRKVAEGITEKTTAKRKVQTKAGSPVPLFLMMTSVMIWIGGVVFFFVEISF
jgi:hypothetical protein